MKALFTGQDYLLFLDKENSELQRLRKERFEAKLTFQGERKDLDKIVSIELADNNAIDGIELKYLPSDAESWEAIKRVQVKINERAYKHVEQRGVFGTRYNGSDKIEIYSETPPGFE